MATKGKLEARITCTAGEFAFTVDDSGGGGAVAGSVAAGDYFHSSAATSGSSFMTAITAALNTAASTDTLTCTISADESGTGRVTITSSGTTAIVWSSTTLRDLLGFTADLPAGTTWTGDYQARGLWLPDCAYKAPNGGGWRGWRESDFYSDENAAGHVFAHMGQELQAAELSWHAVTRARVWIAHESTVNASWEKFAKDCLWGKAGWCPPGGPIRFYPDAATDSTFSTYTVPDVMSIRPTHFHDGWAAGPWTVEIPRMIADPVYSAYG